MVAQFTGKYLFVRIKFICIFVSSSSPTFAHSRLLSSSSKRLIPAHI